MKIVFSCCIFFVLLSTACSGLKKEKEAPQLTGDLTIADSNTTVLVDTLVLEQQLRSLTKGSYRHYKNVQRLDTIAAYIFREFQQYADTTYYQEYTFNSQVYRNVIAVFNPSGERVRVVGAHYDVCGDQEGADDNASGVVGLLQLARLLENESIEERVELVAYTLEEPPFFRSEMMGSFQHAQSLVDRKANVEGMVCLEMIGYFDDAKHSQDYPAGGMAAIYGTRGDYIALVAKMKHGSFVKGFMQDFEACERINTKRLEAPASLAGVDFSDHLNYWAFGFDALMVTDTAFYRNKEYHQKGDVMERLDLRRMARVIEAVFEALR